MDIDKNQIVMSFFLCLVVSIVFSGCSLDLQVANQNIVDQKVNPTDQQMMVYIPEGEFIMGSDLENEINLYKYSAEETKYLDAFWIYQTEVTNRQFVEFLNAVEEHEWMGKPPEYVHIDEQDGTWLVEEGFENFPIHYVNFEAADNYCHWAGGRLPTNEEWEKAARGTDGRIYPWGNDEENVCNLATSLSCVGDLVDVGSYPKGASPYGVLDMAGNVGEWVDGWWNEVNEIRGIKGSWPQDVLAPMYVLTGYFGPPGNYFGYVGIRCVVDIDE